MVTHQSTVVSSDGATSSDSSAQLQELRTHLLVDMSRRHRSALAQVAVVGGAMLLFQVLVVFFAMLLVPASTLKAIQTGTVPATATDDFLKVFLPIFMLAFGFVVGFLGLKRLEQFDAEISSIRRDLTSQLNQDRAIVARDAERFHTELTDRVNGFKETVAQLADQAVRGVVDERVSVLEKQWADFTASTDATVDHIRESLKPYAWLEERKAEVDYLVGIHTVGVAHDRVTAFFAEGKTDIAIRIAEYTAASDLPGAANDYHNLVTELARQDQFPLAVRILDHGLARFPTNVDLLAGAVEYNVSNGDTRRAAEFYDRIRQVGFEHWNWRAFVFCAEYLRAASRIDEAMELYGKFREQIPDDERGYSLPGDYFIKLGRYREAIELLEGALASCRWASQSAVTLSQAYVETGEYEKAIATANRAIESNADVQPSVNQTAVVWQRAVALDALLHRELQKPDANMTDALLGMVTECLIDYWTSVQMNDVRREYRLRGTERVKILRALLQKKGVGGEHFDRVIGELQSAFENVTSAFDDSTEKMVLQRLMQLQHAYADPDGEQSSPAT